MEIHGTFYLGWWRVRLLVAHTICSWPCGATDNASDYGSEDSRFESWQGRDIFYFVFLTVKL